MVAYFSMEIAILPSMPTYSGGLGVLAGDTLRSASDRGLNLAAVTLVHRKGYFYQRLSADGVQTSEEQPWSPEDTLAEEKVRVSITVEGRAVSIRAWRYDMEGVTGRVIPIYMLDTDLPENHELDRQLTDHLYGGDSDYRLRQEAVLGIGGALILAELGYEPTVYHMNEGHAALLTVALMEEQLGGAPLSSISDQDVSAIREHCVFTTHTPVPAGHDRFSMEQARRILGDDCASALERLGCCHEGLLNMTYIALRFSRFVNGVAMQHGDHQRCSCGHLDRSVISTGFRSCVAPVADRQPCASLRNRYSRSRHSFCSPRIEEDSFRRGSQAHWRDAESRGLHARLCSPRRDLQARRPALFAAGETGRNRQQVWRAADPVRGQGSPCR
jgi:starch phosphorylase